jgi:bis(5'-nucleosyl)-tetraphosphatase (symmetrical)
MDGSDGTVRVFIGDVQGCADELEDLLGALPYDAARQRLLFVGDLVNRGPASARTLRRVIELGADSVLGNHDLHLLAAAADQRTPSARDTIGDVLSAADRDELLAWLRRRPLVLEWRDIVLVHAGLHPAWSNPKAVARPLEERIARGDLPLEDENLRFLTRVRYCDAAGRRSEADGDPGPGWAPWDRFYRGERTVVCGHWATRGVVITPRLRALDSGCVWGGKLTAWVAEEDRIVSVPARRAYQQPG